MTDERKDDPTPSGESPSTNAAAAGTGPDGGAADAPGGADVSGAPRAHERRTVTVAVTGASGALYATWTLAALLARGCRVELVVSDYGRRLLRDELGDEAAVERLQPYLVSRFGADVTRGSYVLHSNRDLGARIASGSQRSEAMVIVPCSMKTLAGVAHGLSRNLVERAADVMLKERRPLIIVPRETPMSLPQLRNMVLCAEAGALLLPAMPAFYQMPVTLDDLGAFMAGKILAALGFEHDLYPAWKPDDDDEPARAPER